MDHARSSLSAPAGTASTFLLFGSFVGRFCQSTLLGRESAWVRTLATSILDFFHQSDWQELMEDQKMQRERRADFLSHGCWHQPTVTAIDVVLDRDARVFVFP